MLHAIFRVLGRLPSDSDLLSCSTHVHVITSAVLAAGRLEKFFYAQQAVRLLIQLADHCLEVSGLIPASSRFGSGGVLFLDGSAEDASVRVDDVQRPTLACFARSISAASFPFPLL